MTHTHNTARLNDFEPLAKASPGWPSLPAHLAANSDPIGTSICDNDAVRIGGTGRMLALADIADAGNVRLGGTGSLL